MSRFCRSISEFCSCGPKNNSNAEKPESLWVRSRFPVAPLLSDTFKIGPALGHMPPVKFFAQHLPLLPGHVALLEALRGMPRVSQLRAVVGDYAVLEPFPLRALSPLPVMDFLDFAVQAFEVVELLALRRVALRALSPALFTADSDGELCLVDLRGAQLCPEPLPSWVSASNLQLCINLLLDATDSTSGRYFLWPRERLPTGYSLGPRVREILADLVGPPDSLIAQLMEQLRVEWNWLRREMGSPVESPLEMSADSNGLADASIVEFESIPVVAQQHRRNPLARPLSGVLRLDLSRSWELAAAPTDQSTRSGRSSNGEYLAALSDSVLPPVAPLATAEEEGPPAAEHSGRRRVQFSEGPTESPALLPSLL